MADPRLYFIDRLDLAKSRIRNLGGFVFLCGGPWALDSVPLYSARHLLYSELTSGRKYSDIAARIKFAEDIQDWFRDGVYTDLVLFEEHLAGLSDVIVLVVESAGAIAELGAFSMSDPIAQRLLVVVAEHHYEKESFIRLGPLKRIEDRNDRGVMVYDWQVADGINIIDEPERLRGEVPAIAASIREFMKPGTGQQMFQRTDVAHQMLLICELVDLFGALPFTEIAHYLARLDIGVDEEQVKRFLFLLVKCDLLAIKPKGHGRYYYCHQWESRFSFAYKEGSHIDRVRLQYDITEFYESNERTRAEVIRLIRRAA
ncbi:MAG: retron St85 family effector protein [Dyella sp.]|uniref:retron St85 family effector protein n=1 Tax=Dyella sp. TaxID=1869338 RepID=UPI003F8043CE